MVMANSIFLFTELFVDMWQYHFLRLNVCAPASIDVKKFETLGFDKGVGLFVPNFYLIAVRIFDVKVREAGRKFPRLNNCGANSFCGINRMVDIIGIH